MRPPAVPGVLLLPLLLPVLLRGELGAGGGQGVQVPLHLGGGDLHLLHPLALWGGRAGQQLVLSGVSRNMMLYGTEVLAVKNISNSLFCQERKFLCQTMGTHCKMSPPTSESLNV